MKISKLRNIIRESIKELIIEKEGCGGDPDGVGAAPGAYTCHMNESGGCKTARCCKSCDKVEANDGQDQAMFCDCMGAIGLGKSVSVPPTKDIQSEITEEVSGYDCKCKDKDGNIVGFCKSKDKEKGRGCGCCMRLYGTKMPKPR